MSEIAIAGAAFKSVCPGTSLIIRAESAKVTAWSAPLSVVSVTELPLTDLTVPTALTTGVCADVDVKEASRVIAATIADSPRTTDFSTAFFMTLYYQLNHAFRGTRGKELS